MTQNEKLVRNFYHAFSTGDYATMQRSYHENANFADPVFKNLNSVEVRAMWEMLITSARDLKISASDFRTNKNQITCKWQARYTFSKTGRPVHNIISASFKFQDGLIIEHRDRFSFYRWSRQALGMTGFLLGWTPIIQRKVHQTATSSLRKFMETSVRKSSTRS